MRVLCTGAAGYLGSVLCPRLLAAGHSVVAVDDFRYGQHLSLAACLHDPAFELVRADVLAPEVARLAARADAVVPLAALVGAPLCDRRSAEAERVNTTAVRWLLSQLSPAQLVVFPNTNSGYGIGSNAPCDEESPLSPVSLYGRSKVAAERGVLERERSIVFRLATVFGPSPRMRTDLLVNDLTLRAVRDGSIVLYDPHARRNFVHVLDVAEAFRYALERPDRLIHCGRVFNLGHDDANVTKLELVEAIRRYLPNTDVFEGSGSDPDQRDYLVSNARLAAAGFRALTSLDEGIRQLVQLYRTWPTSVMGNV